MESKETKLQNQFKVLGKTKLVKGSILNPEMAGLRFILNLANLSGKTEGPLFPVLDRKWKQVKQETKGWHNTKTGAYKFGATLETPVQSDTWVISMLCQDDKQKTDLPGLELCLKKVLASAKQEKASIHVSTLLCEMVPELQELLTSHLVNNGVSVYFYQEP
jgi:hypothetical protein